MARKSAAEIKAEVLAEQEALNRASETRAMEMFSGFMTKFMGEMGSARGALGSAAAAANPDADRALAENLAHAMMTASATPQKKALLLTPEQKADRADARAEMISLLIDMQAKGLVPVYRVTRQTFLAETMIYPEWRDPVTKQMRPQEVNWPGVPNQAMVPLVVGAREGERTVIEAAQKVHALYLRSIGFNAGVNQNAPTPFVVDGANILRGNGAPAAPPPTAATAPGFDPRRLGQAAGVTHIPILGTVAAPAIVTP
jgi:hypothetical protein